ncbi:interferon-induced GTP-binding protein Mx2 [Mytilinidion resinicola]|uniref:Interferon-induced GTP-binding protein Mx2 n=1 Tax=Mytilinidion resinicola TaxID=574789 RepID=A0A6A6Y8H6_9PEZI|nr:interferon-induced GTP-binding protein Mx2 [Mytilinidion resinicola]KAF2805000.1 interferon-induced GTP-binding protein Mx2 [Mytilinidion resinicola]
MRQNRRRPGGSARQQARCRRCGETGHNSPSQALLNKIDKLREINVKTIELPQLVVAGDQSSGKSSLLESLTEFSFPQDPGLCTRYATQTSCRRDSEKKVVVSIIPRQGAVAAVEARLRAFRRKISDFTNEALKTIIAEANTAMGIRMTVNDTESGLQTFSEDILKIEISGPEQEHITVIDVPGIFRVPSPPLTTDSDVALVKTIVESYMRNSRTIIIAVLLSNVDITTQEILKMAEVADPSGTRTMGVLTKPDLVTENATQDAIMDLVLRKRNRLKLGYCIVKNRSAHDQISTMAERLTQEVTFFREARWRRMESSGRCGIGSLKTQLQDLLMSISKKELPHVKADVGKQLRQCREDLESMRPSRTEQSSQRMYLGRLVSKFQAITQCALNGYYNSESVFTELLGLKLITNITKANERFSNEFWKKGHKRQFSVNWDDEGERAHDLTEIGEGNISFKDLLSSYPELHDIVDTNVYWCPKPTAFSSDSIIDHIEKVYQSNWGPELFSGTILGIIFREQSEKWEPLVLAHVSESIALVHDYICRLLAHICTEKQLCKAYVQAMKQARFLLHAERDARPSTYNHYFNAEVQKKRQARIESGDETRGYHSNKDNAQQERKDILDVLASYYKVSRKRSVDVVCTQVISHFLLEGDGSPLKVFNSELVMGLDDEQLEMIAGEDAETKRRRSTLGAEIKNLEAAMKVLRG